MKNRRTLALMAATLLLLPLLLGTVAGNEALCDFSTDWKPTASEAFCYRFEHITRILLDHQAICYYTKCYFACTQVTGQPRLFQLCGQTLSNAPVQR